jgi:predicted nucleic-acid-binding Zn-ribbon protein
MKQELQHSYILIPDKSGKQTNLWKITAVDNRNYSIICRTTRKYIPKRLAYKVDGSNVLRTNFKLDVRDSKIEIQKDKYINEMCFNCGYRAGTFCNAKGVDVLTVHDDCYCFRDMFTMHVQDDFQTDYGYLEDENDGEIPDETY